MWSTQWADCEIGVDEILGRQTGSVDAVAVRVLPDGHPVAVTGSYDRTVPVWDLEAGAPLGDPLTGHAGPVCAVAALVLPDGRPVAVTGSLAPLATGADAKALHGRAPAWAVADPPAAG